MTAAVKARAHPRRWVVVAVNLAVIIVLLSGVELYLRRTGMRPYVRAYPGQAQARGNVPWARLDPVLGWTIDPGFLKGQINPQGFRDTKDFGNRPQRAATRLMMLGDSFVVGANMSPDTTLPGLLQTRLKDTEVFSVAVPGWGIDQMYLAYQRYKDVIDPNIVVLVFIDDDIKRVLEAYRVAERLAKPTLIEKDGALVQQESVSEGRLLVNRLLGRSILLSLAAREFYLATDADEIVDHILTAIAEDTKRRNGKMIVMRIPTRDDREVIHRIRRYMGSIGSPSAGRAIVFLDAASDISQVPRWSTDLYVEDGHLNSVGTARVASYLLSHMTD